VWAVLWTGASLPDTIRYTIGLGGDTDAIASMAGAVAGALSGASAIPEPWIERAESTDTTAPLAGRLFRHVTPGHGSPL